MRRSIEVANNRLEKNNIKSTQHFQSLKCYDYSNWLMQAKSCGDILFFTPNRRLTRQVLFLRGSKLCEKNSFLCFMKYRFLVATRAFCLVSFAAVSSHSGEDAC